MSDADPPPKFCNPGFCHCCRTDTTFIALRDWLRDFYICQACGSTPRQRHVQYVLDTRFPGWETRELHESSPSSDYIARHSQRYHSSQYLPGVAPGDTVDDVRCETVEALTFADESLDLFVTQDVLEHVFHPAVAIREIHRVLRPGGAHVFTAPKHKGLIATVQRASLRPDGTIDHPLPAEYHGNPVGDGRALVTYDYGYDFELLLSQWSGASVEVVHTLDRSLGLDAEFNEVFVIRKMETQRPAPPAPPAPPAQGTPPQSVPTFISRLRPVRSLLPGGARKAARKLMSALRREP
jgi:SAM-dependent methyltransferase